MASELGELECLPENPNSDGSKSTHQAAGLPSVLFFCVGHGIGPMCAASQQCYYGCPELAPIFRRLRDGRFDEVSLGEITKKNNERINLRNIDPFDHKTEKARAFRVRGGMFQVFEECDRCAKCYKLYNYNCSDKEGSKPHRVGSCAEDLCHVYCTRETETMLQDTAHSSF